MKIYILPLGNVRKNFCRNIEEELSKLFKIEISALENAEEPSSSYHPIRGQYISSRVIDKIRKYIPPDTFKIIVIVNVDLCTLVREFVFGVAEFSGKIVLVSLFRLKQEFYGFKPNEELLIERMMKEINHELGHTFGLRHCKDLKCCMYFSNSIDEVDNKNKEFCEV